VGNNVLKKKVTMILKSANLFFQPTQSKFVVTVLAMNQLILKIKLGERMNSNFRKLIQALVLK